MIQRMKAVLFGALPVTFCLACHAAEPGDASFRQRVYDVSKSIHLPYRLLTVGSNTAGKPLPVIVFLHGAIARGTDNLEPLNWGPRLLRETGSKQPEPFLLVVPQCPSAIGWTSPIDGHGTEPLDLAVKLVREVLAKESAIDSKRIYLTGVSMGGIGLWSYLCRHPGVFAAGVPVCASGRPSEITTEAVKHPMWAFHSDDDHLIPVESAREMVAAWKAQGGVAKYTEYTGLKHSSWKKAYIEPDLLPWLFSQHL